MEKFLVLFLEGLNVFTVNLSAWGLFDPILVVMIKYSQNWALVKLKI